MSEENQKIEEPKKKPEKKTDPVDEWGSILVDEHIKIFDPETQEILINIRG